MAPGYPTDPAASVHDGSWRIVGDSIQKLTSSVAHTPPTPNPGDPTYSTRSWNWDEQATLSASGSGTTLVLSDNAVMSVNGTGTGSGTFGFAAGSTGNAFTMNTTVANALPEIQSGYNFNLRNGTVTLNSGRMSGTITTESGSNTWTIAGNAAAGRGMTIGGSLAATLTGSNIFNIGRANFTGSIDATNSGANTLNFQNNSTFYGQGNLQGSSGTNIMNFNSGSLVSGAGAYVHASNSATGSNTFNVNAGSSIINGAWLYGGAAASTSTFNLNGGTVRNIQGLESSADNNAGVGRTDVSAAVDLKTLVVNGDYSGSYYGNANQINYLRNMKLVTFGANGTVLEIGSLDQTQTAQISAQTVEVQAGKEFILHEDTAWQALNTPGNIAAGEGNVINDLTISGKALIDRTTIQSANATGSNVVVNSGGELRGHTDYVSTNAGFTDGKANIIGNLLLKTGSTMKPFDNLAAGNTTRNTVFEVQTKGAGSGIVTFEPNSILKTRMFATDSSIFTTIDSHLISASDAVKSQQALFPGTGHSRVIYDPVFGFDYEKIHKFDFELNKDYYFCVVQSNDPIDDFDIVYGTDAFNRLILKSDMIGDWDFILTEDKKSVLLRFRLTALHPLKGGLAAGQTEPNAWHVAKALDHIRYPLGEGEDNYDGNMLPFYAQHFPNHDMMDFYNLFLGIQDGILDAAVMNTALRQLHAEAYSDTTMINHGTMRNFIDSRERNGMSALYAVEKRNYSAAVRQAAANENASSVDAYANLTDIVGFHDNEDEGFVVNPVRFWAAGFGNNGKQKSIGFEYGYDSDVWGGSLGAIKEYGDLYLGLTAGYADVDTEWKELSAENKTRSYLGEALLGIRKGLAFAELHGNVGYFDNKMKRNVVIASNQGGRGIGSYGGNAESKYHELMWGGGVRFGYQWLLGQKYLVVPTLGFNYMETKSSSMRENGSLGGLALMFEKGGLDHKSYRIPAMVRANRSIALGRFVLTPEIRGGFIYLPGDKNATVDAMFAGDPWEYVMPAVGIKRGKWEAQVGATLELSRHGKMFLAANYDYVFREKSMNHNYSVQFGINF